MNLRECLIACIGELKRLQINSPKKKIRVGQLEVSYQTMIDELKKVLEWVYPKFFTSDIQKVVRCCKCKHYKRYRKKGSKQVSYRCSLTMKCRGKDYFCADGQEVEE